MKENGYTLIELTLVVFLLGLMLTIAVPRVRETLIDDGLKSTVKRLTSTVRELRGVAVREQVDYVLHFDLNNNVFWTYSVDMTPEKLDERRKSAFQLPEGVKFAGISQIGVENKTDGEANLMIFKQGHLQPTVLHLAREDRNFTVVFPPFLKTVRVYDSYVDVSPDGTERE